MLFSYKQLFILGLVFIVLQVTFTHGMDGRKTSPKRDRTPPKDGGSGSARYEGRVDQYQSGVKQQPGAQAYYVGPVDSYKQRGGKSDDKKSGSGK